MLLRIAMLPAEGEITLALKAEETDLFLAVPAERFVSLYLRLIFHRLNYAVRNAINLVDSFHW